MELLLWSRHGRVCWAWNRSKEAMNPALMEFISLLGDKYSLARNYPKAW